MNSHSEASPEELPGRTCATPPPVRCQLFQLVWRNHMPGELKDHELSGASEKTPPRLPRNPGILIADDMGLILTLLKFELEACGFTVWLAVDGDDAVDLYRRNHEEM